MFKTFEVRLTIHQRYLSPPDYNSAYRRMTEKGFTHLTTIAGQHFATLGGMYRLVTPFGSVEGVAEMVREAFRLYAWEISFQVIDVASEIDHNLKPVTLLSGGSLASALRRA